MTFDDDFPGAWFNPDGSQKPPYGLLLGLVGIEGMLLAIAMTWPNVAAYGIRNFLASITSA